MALAALPTSYEYYTDGGITAGLSDKQPYFTLNNKNITIYSGAFHYFRVPRAYWRDRLRKMRAAGLNTVETYVPWNLHEPQSGVYDFGNGGSDFEDFLHVEEFLKIAKEEDLFALVRAGPYICSEWEFGGLPSWILRNTSSVRNSKDQNYLSYVKRYFNILLPLLALLQFQKGGPIIGFQIENEYGNTGNDDVEYLKYIQQIFEDNNLIELYYTSDPPSANGLGAIPGILQTANFNSNPKWQLDKLNQLQHNKPTMTMEFWTGWFDHWLEDHHTVSAQQFKSLLEEILDYPSSVNHYMFVGSTNFGFTNGANSLKSGMDNTGLQPTTTSYDYDSPITEYGDYTEKYQIVKDAIASRNPVITKLPDQPKVQPLIKYESLQIEGQLTLADIIYSEIQSGENVIHHIGDPIPMEQLPINSNSGQSFGYIVYRHTHTAAGAVKLTLTGTVRDTLLVLVNGTLRTPVPSKKSDVDGVGFWKLVDTSLDLQTDENTPETTYVIDVIVENNGRNNFGGLDQFRQFKGLTDSFQINGKNMMKFDIVPLEFKKSWNNALTNWQSLTSTQSTPALYKFTLNINNDPQDTYIDSTSWTKGITIVNGFVLGRHFFVGPQQSLYLPAPLLNKGENTIIVFEHYNAPDELTFVDHPIFQSRG
ncbi:beta-galactosidase-1-like protein 2 [Diabrotica virgifera virgifera]|uniref:Beta-galactosidase n=1 Tax=Diabrotica virgifera virgifera TaxID=50390 RepID=A0ABM5K6C8_DIAVI|nr:beta-galactosidase-1-like protein 2 [Diabrotica virgifera virgifera]